MVTAQDCSVRRGSQWGEANVEQSRLTGCRTLRPTFFNRKHRKPVLTFKLLVVFVDK